MAEWKPATDTMCPACGCTEGIRINDHFGHNILHCDGTEENEGCDFQALEGYWNELLAVRLKCDSLEAEVERLRQALAALAEDPQP